jgi:hypothetical protein
VKHTALLHCLLEARKLAEQKIHPRGNDQPLVRDVAAASKAHHLLAGIDAGHLVPYQSHAVAFERAVAAADVLHAREAAEHQV